MSRLKEKIIGCKILKKKVYNPSKGYAPPPKKKSTGGGGGADRKILTYIFSSRTSLPHFIITRWTPLLTYICMIFTSIFSPTLPLKAYAK